MPQIPLPKETTVFNRQRRLERRDIGKGLFQTHNLGVDAIIDGTRFPEEIVNSPVTFTVSIRPTDVSPVGVIFELGSSVIGTVLTVVNSTTIGFTTGAGSGLGGLDDSVTVNELGSVGSIIHVALALIPTIGQAKMWINGQIVSRAINVPPDPFPSNLWNGILGGGSVGQNAVASFNNRAGFGISLGPADFLLVEPLRVFSKTVPQGFTTL